jgi:hypothetical protein
MEKEYRIIVLKLLLTILLKLCNQRGMSEKESLVFDEADKFLRKLKK